MVSQQWLPVDYQRTPIRAFYINGQLVPAPEIKEAELSRDAFMHDHLRVSFVYPDVRRVSELSGAPVVMRYGGGNAQGTFHGYVKDATPDIGVNTLGIARLIEFTCLGPSSIMQSGSPRNFAGMTADAIAKQVVLPYQLAVISDRHPYVWPSLMQTDESDWQFLVCLAQRIGFLLVVDGVTVYFIDPLRIVTMSGTSVPLAAAGQSSNPGLLRADMKIGVKANTPAFANNVVSSIDALGNVVSGSSAHDARQSFLGGVTTSAGITRRKTGTVSVDTATARANAFSCNTPDSWPYETQLVAKGDGRLRPGTLAALHVGDAAELSGLWLCTSVVHNMNRGSYLMNAVLNRDSISKSSVPTPVVVDRGRSGPLSTPASPVLFNNRWTSPWSAT